mmetsp:Transcript_47676/g.102099  ORF Transcript_47676/g.102099 Transcript_47676/m.102099 type:complete len:501 (-) Transcript_47676:84-1586(-)
MANSPYYRDEDRAFLQRDDTMSLDVIRPKDIPKGRVMYVKDELTSLKTEDIHKAKPHYEHLQYLEKPDFSVGCTHPDHPGGQARSYYMPMDRRPRDLSLTTADIEFAQPKTISWKGSRHTDPVCPNYELPSCMRREPTPPRWNGRHTNATEDIEYSRPRVLHPERNYSRNPNDAADIEYATANYREKLARATSLGRGPERTYDVSDINLPPEKQKRCTNPMEPVYTVPTSRTTSLHAKYSEEKSVGIDPPPIAPEQVGEVHGSKPRRLQWDNGEPQFSLLREDIAGTVPQRWIGSVPHNIYDPPEVRAMISFHDPSDIPGAQVGSLLKGIATGRSVNPLNPRYPALDGNGKPTTMPTLGAERQGPGMQSHPLVRSQANASSAPQLRPPSGAGGQMGSRYVQDGGASAPFGSGRSNAGGSAVASPAGSVRHPSQAGFTGPSPHYQRSRGSSGRSTPAQSGYQMLQQGGTLRLPPQEYVLGAEMSRRSSSQASLRSSAGRPF